MANESAAASKFSFEPPEWLKSFNGFPNNPYVTASKGALGFTASRLQDQADHLRKLAECADFAEAMKCQLDFAQESWSRSVGEASKLFDHLRTQPS